MSHHGCPERLPNMSKGYPEEGTSQPTMEVLVETLAGTAFEMTVSPSDTIFAIKSKIFRVEGIPVCQQHLVYNLRELEDGRSLREQRVADGARLRLVLGMRGGPVATRRLPPPPPANRDLHALLDSNREESAGAGVSGAGGCKVTVVVVREGERVSVLRVLENEDGTYSPLANHAAAYSSSLRSLSEDGVECDSDSGSGGDDALCAVRENAVTMGKMLELRGRMETLSLQRASRPQRPHRHAATPTPTPTAAAAAAIQKTRSEETLPGPGLFEEHALRDYRNEHFVAYGEAEDSFAPLCDGTYTRYDYDCSFADRYTLLPPIDSDRSVQDAVDAERLKLSDALAGSILVKSGRRDEDAAAILEEDVAECRLPPAIDSSRLAADGLAPIATAGAPAYCVRAIRAIVATDSHADGVTGLADSLSGGETGAWRTRVFGSGSQLAGVAAPGAAVTGAPGGAATQGGGRLSAGGHSASSLQLRAPPPRHHPPLSDALFSTSTSDLETLRRNRLLPALSRHPNTEHLHLSDDLLDLQQRARHRLEVGGERRQRRIRNIAEAETGPPAVAVAPPAPAAAATPQPKKGRVRCALCRRRLTVATVHTCRCGGEFCAPHRYAEAHGCHYDYKALAMALRDPAPISAPKLPKI